MMLKVIILTLLINYCTTQNGPYARTAGQLSSGSSGGFSTGSYGGSGTGGSGSGNIIIPVGVSRHHPIEFRDFKLPAPENSKPRTLELEGGHIPLTILFPPRTSQLSVIDGTDGRYGNGLDIQHSRSIEEPQVTYHEVNKPLFEEVHQVIKCVFSENKPYQTGSYDSVRLPPLGNSNYGHYNMC